MMPRKILPSRRPQVTFAVKHGLNDSKHNTFTVSIGSDGDTENIREVFIGGRPSEQMNIMRDSAILISLALQHGCPLDTIVHALTRDDFNQPATPIGSVVHGIAQYLQGGGDAPAS